MSEPYKILIVDDEPRNIEILRVKLEAEGFQTLIAEDGESAIFAFENHLPDMVLLDVMMPGVDGRDVCRALKERSGKVFIPVVLVTALTTSEAKNEGFAAGADDYITKPVDFTELLARIRNLKRLQGMAHGDQRRSIEFPSYRAGRAPLDEVFKILADGMGAEERTMFRVYADGKKAYIGVEGNRFIHARTDHSTGRDALDEVLLWPAVEYESVVMKILQPNVDVAFEDIASWWVQRLDVWRLVSEKLPPRQTVLVANTKRAAEAAGRGPEFAATLKLFGEGLSLDQALRVSDLDTVATLRAVGELYYRGLLRRVGEAPAGLVNRGAPLLLGTPAGVPAPVEAAPQAAPVPAAPAVDVTPFQRQIEDLKIEVLSLNASNDSLREENAELRMRLDSDKQRYAELSGELAKAKEELQAAASKPADGGSDSLRRSLSEKDKEVVALSNQVIAATARSEMQAARIQELQTRIAALERATPAQPKVPTDVLRLQSTLVDLEDEVKRLRAKVAEPKPAADDAALRGELAARDAEIASLRKELALAKEVLLDEEAEVDPETGMAKPLDATPEMRALRAALRQRDAEVEALRQQLIAAAQEYEDQRFMVEELKKLLDEQKKSF